jgi:hypothetical protein
MLQSGYLPACDDCTECRDPANWTNCCAACHCCPDDQRCAMCKPTEES